MEVYASVHGVCFILIDTIHCIYNVGMLCILKSRLNDIENQIILIANDYEKEN